MAIPTLAEAKAAAVAEEIAAYEADLTKHLETPSTINYLEDTAITTRQVIRVYPGKVLSDLAIEALTDSIEAAGWDEVLVENTTLPARSGIGNSGAPAEPQVVISFKPAGGSSTPPVTPPDDGADPEEP